MQDFARFGSVVSKSDRVAVVDVTDRYTDDVGSKPTSRRSCACHGVLREAKVQKFDAVTGGVERGCDTGEAVWHYGVRLTLAIRAHEQDACSALRVNSHR